MSGALTLGPVGKFSDPRVRLEQTLRPPLELGPVASGCADAADEPGALAADSGDDPLVDRRLPRRLPALVARVDVNDLGAGVAHADRVLDDFLHRDRHELGLVLRGDHARQAHVDQKRRVRRERVRFVPSDVVARPGLLVGRAHVRLEIHLHRRPVVDVGVAERAQLLEPPDLFVPVVPLVPDDRLGAVGVRDDRLDPQATHRLEPRVLKRPADPELGVLRQHAQKRRLAHRLRQGPDDAPVDPRDEEARRVERFHLGGRNVVHVPGLHDLEDGVEIGRLRRIDDVRDLHGTPPVTG